MYPFNKDNRVTIYPYAGKRNKWKGDGEWLKAVDFSQFDQFDEVFDI